MKITEYAKQAGITPLTARTWYHKGLIPGAYQLPTGTIIVPDNVFKTENNTHKPQKTIIYARVSSQDQKKRSHKTSRTIKKLQHKQ